MGGAGKWIKKNPLAAVALLGAATGGLGLLAAAPAAAGGAAAAGLGESLAAAGALEGIGAAGAGAAGAGGAAAGGLGTAALFGPEAGTLGSGFMSQAAMPEVMMGSTGAFGQFAPIGLLDNTAPAYAALDAGKFNPSTPGFMDRFSKGDLWAMEKGMGLLGSNDQQQMPVAQPQGYRGPGQQNAVMSPYDDPELKKRMAMMAQSGRFYG
jgi:hypothetical protein